MRQSRDGSISNTIGDSFINPGWTSSVNLWGFEDNVIDLCWDGDPNFVADEVFGLCMEFER